MTISELASSSKVYIGNTLVKKVYIGNNRVWSASKLPDGYEDVPYISSTKTGGQYIDLGCKLMETTDDIKIDIKFNIIGNGLNSTGQGTLISCKKEVSPYPGFLLRVQNYSDVTDTRLEFAAKWNFVGSKLYSNTYYVLDYEGTAASFPTTETSRKPGQLIEDSITFNNIPSTQLHDITTYLFCTANSSGTLMRFCEAELYYLKITKGSQVVRDLLPAKRLSDNEIGLYDILNNVFYPSAGANSFVAGTAS